MTAPRRAFLAHKTFLFLSRSFLLPHVIVLGESHCNLVHRPSAAARRERDYRSLAIKVAAWCRLGQRARAESFWIPCHAASAPKVNGDGASQGSDSLVERKGQRLGAARNTPRR